MVVDPDNRVTEITKVNNTAHNTVIVIQKDAPDTTPPTGTLTINGGVVSTNSTDVLLSLNAQDNVGVKWMLIDESDFNSTLGRWINVGSSGWISYTSAYAWKLSDTSGVKYLQARFADAAANISDPPSGASINYSPVMAAIDAGEWRLYQQTIPAGASVSISVVPSSGDQDLYVWAPGNSGQPDYYSDNSGTAEDRVSFTAPVSGIYQIQVYGYEAGEYSIAVSVGSVTAAGRSVSLLSAQSRGLQGSKVVPSKPLASEQPVVIKEYVPVLEQATSNAPHLVLKVTRFEPRLAPFSIELTADEARQTADAGEFIFYALTYANSGTVSATGVVITETLPLSTTFFGPQIWTRIDDRTYVYSVGSLDAGAAGGVEFVVGKAAGLALSTVFTNTVTIGDDGRNGRDLHPAGTTSDILQLQRMFLPVITKRSASGW